jgi:hypothetical protein
MVYGYVHHFKSVFIKKIQDPLGARKEDWAEEVNSYFAVYGWMLD